MKFLGRKKHLPSHRVFSAHFGVSSYVCNIIWSKLQERRKCLLSPMHLLWTINYLKCYPSWVVSAGRVKVSHTNYHANVMFMIMQLKELDLVSVLGLGLCVLG